MRANRYTATIDACVLASALPRNLVLSLAEAGYFRPRWSEQILTETRAAIASILKSRGDPNADVLAAKHCSAIKQAFPEAAVDGHAALILGLNLPDDKDRHVLAAAIHSRSAVIVTENLHHFPDARLTKFEIQSSPTDDFLADVIDLYTPALLRRSVPCGRGSRSRRSIRRHC